MPNERLSYTDPFGTGYRPYLAVHLTGANGKGGNVVGLLDTGADVTSMPVGFASLMGYGAQTLTPITVGTASAPASALQATLPCAARVVGIEDVQFPLHPVFVFGSTGVLWGRTDLMKVFRVLFDEAAATFSLDW
jgi:hypothetical protein